MDPRRNPNKRTFEMSLLENMEAMNLEEEYS